MSVEDIFSCEQCGYCCHGETTVSLDDTDVKRMCDHLGMSFEEACEKYLRVTGTIVQMKTVDGHCIFFKGNCSVHLGRPWRCRQWPLHPSILGDQSNFTAIASSCPGIKKDIGYKKFCAKLKDVLEICCK